MVMKYLKQYKYLILAFVAVFTGMQLYLTHQIKQARIEAPVVSQTAIPEPEKPYVFDEDKLFDLVNDYREENGLPRLVRTEALDKSADDKCEDIREHAYWSHDNPYTGETFDQLIQREHTYLNVGENLIKDITDEKNALERWEESPSHNENMLHKAFDKTGIAICEIRNDTFAVQHFAQ